MCMHENTLSMPTTVDIVGPPWTWTWSKDNKVPKKCFWNPCITSSSCAQTMETKKHKWLGPMVTFRMIDGESQKGSKEICFWTEDHSMCTNCQQRTWQKCGQHKSVAIAVWCVQKVKHVIDWFLCGANWRRNCLVKWTNCWDSSTAKRLLFQNLLPIGGCCLTSCWTFYTSHLRIFAGAHLPLLQTRLVAASSSVWKSANKHSAGLL